jgi:hypothetical protein
MHVIAVEERHETFEGVDEVNAGRAQITSRWAVVRRKGIGTALSVL